MGSIVGAVIGGGLAYATGGLSLAAGASLGGAIGGALQGQSQEKSATAAQVAGLQAGESTQAATLANQLELQNQALQEQQTQYTNDQATQTPYMQAGNAALNEYTNLLIPGTNISGTNITTPTANIPNGGTPTTAAPVASTGQNAPGVPAPTAVTPAGGSTGDLTAQQQGANQLAALAQTPGYQFELQQGTLALEHGAAATTGVLSSAESQALMNYGQGLAGTTYDTFMNRLQGLATNGQTAATNSASEGQANVNAQTGILENASGAYGTSGANTSQLQANVGAAQAAGLNAQASANNSLANGLLSQALPSILGTTSSNSGSGSTPTSAVNLVQPSSNPTLTSTAGGSFQATPVGVNLAGGTLSGLSLSDKRIKRNIKLVGKDKGQKLYKFNYAGEKKKYIGVLAQDVEKKRPDAVYRGPGGLKMVNYKKLGLQMKEA